MSSPSISAMNSTSSVGGQRIFNFNNLNHAAFVGQLDGVWGTPGTTPQNIDGKSSKAYVCDMSLYCHSEALKFSVSCFQGFC